MGNIQLLNMKSDTARDMTKGVVTCLRKGKWFNNAKMVTKLKVMPKRDKNVAALPAKTESMGSKAKGSSWHTSWSDPLDMLRYTNP